MPLALKILEMSKAGASVLACASYFQCVLLGETSLTTKRTEGGTKFTKYFPFRFLFHAKYTNLKASLNFFELFP
jgi:hypothetical protein